MIYIDKERQNALDWRQRVTDPDERMVFDALSAPEWDFRTVDGIFRETGLQPEQIKTVFGKYPEFVRESAALDQYGRKIYTLSSKPVSLRERLATLRFHITKSVT